MRLSPCSPAPLVPSTRFHCGVWVVGVWLAALISLLPGSAIAAGFSPEQRREIEDIIQQYLTKNPDVLLDALQAAKDNMEKESHDKASATLVSRRHDIYDDPDTPTGGNPRGDVSLVEFFDYRCPYCKQVEPALESLLREDRQLRFVYKEFPVLGPESVVAARAALAARKQDKYAALHQRLMALKGHFEEAEVMQAAGAAGLDIAQLKRDMAAPEIDRILKANSDLAKELDIRGTPGFVIGEEIVPGAVSLDSLKQLIATARRK